MFIPNEYSIKLRSTEEIIQITEINKQAFDQFKNNLKPIQNLITKCSFVPTEILQEAKMGHTDRFQKCLNISPVGCLVQIDNPICKLIYECGMADINKCQTKNVSRNKGKFPLCWEYQTNSDDIYKYVSSIIVHAWREGKYIVIEIDA
jgi:hypothetical protein